MLNTCVFCVHIMRPLKHSDGRGGKLLMKPGSPLPRPPERLVKWLHLQVCAVTCRPRGLLAASCPRLDIALITLIFFLLGVERTSEVVCDFFFFFYTFTLKSKQGKELITWFLDRRRCPRLLCLISKASLLLNAPSCRS